MLNYTLSTSAGYSSFLDVHAGAVTLPTSGGTLNIFGGGSLSTGTYSLISYGSLVNSWNSEHSPSSAPRRPATPLASFNTGNMLDLVLTPPEPPARPTGSGTPTAAGRGATSGNWTGGVPGTGQDTAVFGTVLTSGTADGDPRQQPQPGSLGFSTTGANSYMITPRAPAR